MGPAVPNIWTATPAKVKVVEASALLVVLTKNTETYVHTSNCTEPTVIEDYYSKIHDMRN